jgi:hypothetical protein
VSDPTNPLHVELERLLRLITEARQNGNPELADLLTDAAAKCLMQIAGNAAARPVPEQHQPVAQQQQQIQPEDDDKDGQQ